MAKEGTPGLSIDIREFCTFKEVSLRIGARLVFITGVPGSGKSMLLNLIAASALVASHAEVHEPSKVYHTIFDSFIPGFRMIVKDSTLVNIKFMLGDKASEVVVEGFKVGYPRLKRWDIRVRPFILPEHRVSIFHRWALGHDKVESNDYTTNSVYRLISEIRYHQKELTRVGIVFEEYLRKFLNTDVRQPVDLDSKRMYYNVPLYRESYTTLNLILLAAGFALTRVVGEDEKSLGVLVVDLPEHGLSLHQLPILAEVIVDVLQSTSNTVIIMATHNNLLIGLVVAKLEAKQPDKARELVKVYELSISRERITQIDELDLHRVPSYIVDGYARILREIEEIEEERRTSKSKPKPSKLIDYL